MKDQEPYRCGIRDILLLPEDHVWQPRCFEHDLAYENKSRWWFYADWQFIKGITKDSFAAGKPLLTLAPVIVYPIITTWNIYRSVSSILRRK